MTAIGLRAKHGLAISADEGLVKNVGSYRVTALKPATGGPEHEGGFVGIIGHEFGGFPGERGGLVAVMEAHVRIGIVLRRAVEFVFVCDINFSRFIGLSGGYRHALRKRAQMYVPVG